MTSLDPSAAAVWDGVDHGFTVTPQPRPTLAVGELLVDIELATICGSDLHTVNGDRSTPLPTVLGHEAVGHVVAANEASTADGQLVTVGDRVTWTIGTSCGSCRRCRRPRNRRCTRESPLIVQAAQASATEPVASVPVWARQVSR